MEDGLDPFTDNPTKENTDTSLAIADEDEENLSSDEITLLARIPLMAGSSKKAAYLSYRSCGFTPQQSCDLVGISISLISKWRQSDRLFKKIETEDLKELQERTGADVVKFEFMRNMRMLLRKDFQVIARGMNDMESLSSREYEYFKNLRKFYTPADLLSLEKAIHPEKHMGDTTVIQLTWNSRMPEVDVIDSPEVKELPLGE